MSTLERIRNRAGLLVAIVIGMALLAFILGDLFSQGGAALRGDRFEIAEIDGKSVSYKSFRNEVENLVKVNKFSQRKSSLDPETRERIREQVWQTLTREYVMEDEYDELGLGVGQDELWDMVQGENIHPLIKRIFTNPETGQVNTLQIIRFLKQRQQDPSLENYWLYLEDQMIKERKFSKFNNLISQSIYIPSQKAKQLASLNSTNVDFNFIVERFSSISDSMVSIDKKDLKDYYQKHEASYKQSASRDIEYVSFDIEPTEEDYTIVKNELENLKSEFLETKNNAEFVNLNSDISFEDDYKKKEELSDSIADFIFNAEEGGIYGPYLENEYYKFAKLVDTKQLPDSVKARHILIQPDRRSRNVQQARNKADSLMNLIKNGADFAELARKHSADKKSATEGGSVGWFKEGEMVEAFSDTCFFSEIGEVKLVTSPQTGFHIVEVTGKGRKVKKAQVAILARKVDPSSETYNNIYNKASRFAGKHRTYDEFIEGINEEDLTKKVANNIQRNAKQIAGLENARKLIRSAFETKEKEIIKSKEDNQPIFEIKDQFVIAFVTEARKDGIAPFDEVKEDIKVKVKENKKAEKLAEKMKNAASQKGSLDAVASELGLQLQTASNITYSSFNIRGAGAEPKLVGAALAMDPNKISAPVKGENGVYLIEVTNRQENNNISPDMIKQREIQGLTRTATYEVYNALKEAAKIQDKRYKFY